MKLAFLVAASLLILCVTPQCNQCADPLHSLPVWTDIASKWQCEGINRYYPDEKCKDTVEMFCTRRHDLGGDLYQMFFRDNPNIIGIDPEQMKRTRNDQLQTTLYCRNSTWRLADPALPAITNLLCDQFIINATLWEQKYLIEEEMTTEASEEVMSTTELNEIVYDASTPMMELTTESPATSEEYPETATSSTIEPEETTTAYPETETTNSPSKEPEKTTTAPDDFTTDQETSHYDYSTTETPQETESTDNMMQSTTQIIDLPTEEPTVSTGEATTQDTIVVEDDTPQLYFSTTAEPETTYTQSTADPVETTTKYTQSTTKPVIETITEETKQEKSTSSLSIKSTEQASSSAKIVSTVQTTTEVMTTTEMTTHKQESSLVMPIRKQKQAVHDAPVIEYTETSPIQTQLRPPTSAIEFLILPPGVIVDNSTTLSDVPKNVGGFIDPPRGFILNELRPRQLKNRPITNKKKISLYKRRKPLVKTKLRKQVIPSRMRKHGRNPRRQKQPLRKRRYRNPKRRSSSQLKWKQRQSTTTKQPPMQNVIY